jgi:hypothetical protein
MVEIIGQGERASLKILKEKFGEFSEYKTQMLLRDMVTREYEDTFSQRQMKETIDIVVYPLITKPIAVRIQDKHHSTQRMGVIDNIQKQMLLWNGYGVADIWYYECPELWKDNINIKSRQEFDICFYDSLTF